MVTLKLSIMMTSIFVVTLKLSIMMTLIIMILIMILSMVMNIEKLEALEHYLKSLIEIIINQ